MGMTPLYSGEGRCNSGTELCLGGTVRTPRTTTDRYIIVSADGHAGLKCEEYRPYLDSAFHTEFDEFLAERETKRSDALKMNYDYIMGWETENEEGLRGAYDAEQRDKELDADGVTAEVIFPDSDAITGMESPPFGAGLSAGAIADPRLAFAGARAHNRFLVDLCATSPERRAGIALVPVCHDIDLAVKEIESLAGVPGIRGVMIPTMWHDRKPYNHRDYDPVWAACAAADLPVHCHSGEAPQSEYGDNVGIYLAEVVWWTHRPIAHLLFSGAFERHPDLKFVVTEGAAYWVPDMKWKWDQYFGGGHTTKKLAALMKGKISKLPSEYFGENIFIGASTMSREEIRRRHAIGCDVVMWGTDYPHPEGTWPHTVERLAKDFRDVPVEDARKMLGETAARCYGFDLDALAPIADKIGPTPADLGQDVTRRTDPEEIRRAEWWKDEYGVSFQG
jgi:predicted TIM-barrel fold metal-dependent hydrolase